MGKPRVVPRNEKKPRPIPPLNAALTHLRVGRNWDQNQLAWVAGTSRTVISDLERGWRKLTIERLTELATVMGYGEDEVTIARLFHDLLANPDEKPTCLAPMAPSPFEARLAARIALRIALTEAVRQRSHMLSRARARRIERARHEAKLHWKTLRELAPSAQQEAIENSPHLLNWAFVERLCDESEGSAADDPAEALRLAGMALRGAELAPGDKAWQFLMQGYAHAFVGNSQRVAGDLRASEVSFAAAWTLWNQGASAGLCPLAEWRLHDLEASLRRGQRRFAAALACLAHAFAGAPSEAKARILLKKQFTLEQAGDVEAALAVMEEVTPLVASTKDLRLQWIIELNSATMLCHLGRFGDAESRLPNLNRITSQLSNKLDTARVRWLTGRVAAGLGRLDEARAAFEQVQRVFSSHRIGIDAALVSLDLAIVYLRENRIVEVVLLADEMMTVFRAQRIHREMIAALRLFIDAAHQGNATIDLAQSVRDFLLRARRDPNARFNRHC